MTNENALPESSHSRDAVKLTLAWLVVGVPLLWGVVETLTKAFALFR